MGMSLGALMIMYDCICELNKGWDIKDCNRTDMCLDALVIVYYRECELIKDWEINRFIPSIL